MTEQIDIEVSIDKWAYGGEAMGRLEDGRVIFVPDTMPGEKITVRIIENKKGFARGVLVNIIEASPLRIDAKCEFFGICNGCSYQHIDIKLQHKTKIEILSNQLSRIGGIKNPNIGPSINIEDDWAFQYQATFILNKEGELCFSDRYNREYIPANKCPLLTPELSARVEQLSFPDLPDLAQVQLRIGEEDEDLLILETFTDDPFDFEIDFPISVVQIGPETTHILSDRFYQLENFLGNTYRISAASDTPTSVKLFQEISKILIDEFNADTQSKFVHVHAGIGLLTSLLAPQFENVIAIENNSSAAEDFIFNLDSFENIELYEAESSQVLPALKGDPATILISPAGSGINRFDLDAILNYAPPAIGYLSQNPSTLSRDAKRLSEKGYVLSKIMPINNSPHTSKIDSLSFWIPK